MEHWGPVSSPTYPPPRNDSCLCHTQKNCCCSLYSARPTSWKINTANIVLTQLVACGFMSILSRLVGLCVSCWALFSASLREKWTTKKRNRKYPPQIFLTSEEFCPPQCPTWMFSHAANALSRDYDDMMLLTPECDIQHAEISAFCHFVNVFHS